MLITESLAYIFNLCITNGVFSRSNENCYCNSNVYNSGNLNDPSNFRPISLLPVISKIFEKCIYVRLYKYLERIKLISNKQFGFRRNKNTEDAISYFYRKLAIKISQN